jgi:hypothetical protein
MPFKLGENEGLDNLGYCVLSNCICKPLLCIGDVCTMTTFLPAEGLSNLTYCTGFPFREGREELEDGRLQ